MESSPIDLVYTWVDGSDPVFTARLQKYKREHAARTGKVPNFGSVGPHRFRDLDNLRFSLRSVEQNAPWVRRIFIVTNGQVPRWLRQSERIKIVTHREIFPQPKNLPTFNSSAIGTCLHRIPGLSRFFLYLNDDMFVARPTAEDYFLGKNGLPKLLFGTQRIEAGPDQSRLWYRQLANLAGLLSRQFPECHDWHHASHGPTLFDRTKIEKLYSMWSGEVDRTRGQRFRAEDDLLLHPLYANALAALDQRMTDETGEHHEKATMNEADLRVVSVGDPNVPWRDNLAEIVRDPPRFICLNDNVSPEHADKADFDEIERAHRAFLETMFPAASPHEQPEK